MAGWLVGWGRLFSVCRPRVILYYVAQRVKLAAQRDRHYTLVGRYLCYRIYAVQNQKDISRAAKPTYLPILPTWVRSIRHRTTYVTHL